jgi:hypothetical protein
MADTQTIFFTECDASVFKAIEARKAIYRSENRSSTDHTWLFKKMATASATAVNKVSGRTSSLTPPQGGGIGAVKSLYKGSKSTIDGRFLPKPHINTVKISNEGDFGSIKKCEMSFTVYSRADLDKMQPFFDIGANLTVNYGWKYSGGPFGTQGEFNGIIYNFSYQVNASGGFDCTTFGMGPGIATLAANVKAAADGKGKSYKDPLGNTVNYINLSSWLKGLIANAANIQPKTIDDITGVGCVKMPTSWGAADNSAEKKDAAKTAESAPAEDVPKYYISLEKLVALVKEKVLNAAANRMKEITFRCDSDTTLGNMPSTENLVSAAPNEMLFPGYCKYGENHSYSFGVYDSSFIKGDLSKTMLSIDWLVDEVLAKIGESTQDKSKSIDATIAKFFKIIFDKIHQNSGTRFKLSLSSNPKDGKEFVVVDVNYIPGDTIKVLELTAVTEDSICRSISLAAKIPSEMVTMAYVRNASTLSNANGTGLTSVVGGVSTSQESPETAQPALADILKTIDSAPLTATTITSLEAALKRVYIGGNDTSGAPSKEAIPYPIDFSATIDGLEGFIFGNTITTNYLPSVYHDATGTKVAFTITKVDHTIANNDWTTTLSTVCRIFPTA